MRNYVPNYGHEWISSHLRMLCLRNKGRSSCVLDFSRPFYFNWRLHGGSICIRDRSYVRTLVTLVETWIKEVLRRYGTRLVLPFSILLLDGLNSPYLIVHVIFHYWKTGSGSVRILTILHLPRYETLPPPLSRALAHSVSCSIRAQQSRLDQLARVELEHDLDRLVYFEKLETRLTSISEVYGQRYVMAHGNRKSRRTNEQLIIKIKTRH